MEKGLLGAILGGIVGCMLWLLVDASFYNGYFVGYFIFSIVFYGYRKGIGAFKNNTVVSKGAKISLFISLIMIFISNYIILMLDYHDYYQIPIQFNNIFNVITKVSNFLIETDGWFNALKNLIIGYIFFYLSILKVLYLFLCKDE